MTEIGATFTNIAETLVRLHGFGTNKMTSGYSLYKCDNYEIDKYNLDKAQLLDRLVEMGYLRKFITAPHIKDKHRNWRYQFTVQDVCFGLTEKGWEVAPQFLSAYERQTKLASAHYKAKAYFDRVKDTNPISYEEALEMALQGIL